MFLSKTDMPSTMYGYQIEQITEGNDDILDIAMQAAVEEVRSYLTGNNMREWQDGRIQYDVEAIFEARGTERNPLILKHCITVAKWWLVDLCNADIIEEQARDRYDRATAWLKQLASGKVTMSTLPTLDPEDSDRQPFSFGSRRKFRYE